MVRKKAKLIIPMRIEWPLMNLRHTSESKCSRIRLAYNREDVPWAVSGKVDIRSDYAA